MPPATVLRARGGAYETLGDFECALADYERALEIVRDADDWRAEWQTLRDLGVLWTGRDYTRAGDFYRQAHERAQTAGDAIAIAIARSLNSLGNWLLNVDQLVEALQHHEEALATFEGLSDQNGVAETLDFLGMASYLSGDLIRGTRYYERGVALMRELNERKLLASALATMPHLRGMTSQTDSLVPATSLTSSSAEGYEALAIAREIGWSAGETYAHMQLGYATMALAEYTRAFDHVRAGMAIASEIEHQQWLSALGCVHGGLLLDLYALDEAEGILIEALRRARTIGSHVWIGFTSSFLALCTAERGRLDTAAAVLDDALPPGAPV